MKSPEKTLFAGKDRLSLPAVERKALPGMLKWVAALRSHRFKQGLGYLCDPLGKHCCLGVWCVVSDVPKKKGINAFLFGSEERTGELAPSIAGYSVLGARGCFSEYITLHRVIGGKECEVRVGNLGALNDHGVGFGAIAYIIEHYFYDPNGT